MAILHRVLKCYYRPQTKFAKVMFLQVSVCPQGEWDVHGRRGHVWQSRVCMAGGMCGMGVHGGGHVWQGDVHGGGHAWQGGHAS